MANFLYNPDQKLKKQLKEEFVVRTEILDDIISDLENSDMSKPEQHYLLVGQRGTGKTTMLLRIRYAIEDSKKLNKWLIPISFNEEQYNITELANLWESVAHYLEDYHGFENLSNEMERNYDKPNFEEICYDILENALEKTGQKIVLLIDNIGDLFKKIGGIEVKRLREILQTKKYIRLIAGSPFYLESILDYKQPLFEFFKIKRLEGLNQLEAEKLLLKLGDVYNEKEKIERIIKETPERIETLRILTNGVPRTIALMFRIFIDHEHESSLKDLERILDAVTPLYKHRMDDLPTQQQKIVDAVAKNWDAISVKELKTKVRLDSKIISAQLRQLEKNQIIEKVETGTKNHLYLLRERFWNIWYLMRYGRKTDSERVIWLVRFLESWCSNDDFEKRIQNYVSQIKNGGLDEQTMKFYGEVYTSIKNITSTQKYLLKRNTPKNISEKIIINENEAVEHAVKLSSEKNHIEAIKALLESDKLSENNKALISNEIRNLNISDSKDFLFDLMDNEDFRYYEEKEGYLTLILEINVKLFALSLVSEQHEDTLELINITHQFIESFKIHDFNHEYRILSKFIILLLMHKKYSTVDFFFDLFQDIDLKEVIKPFYYSYIYISEGNKSKKLNIYGNEIKEPAEKIINSIKKLQHNFQE